MTIERRLSPEEEEELRIKQAELHSLLDQLAQRRMRAAIAAQANGANYLSALVARQETDLQQTPTSTEYSYEFLSKWGTEGQEDGQFEYPVGLAIGGDGNVYVADGENGRIQVFDPQGRFLRKWGTEGQEDGQFSWPWGLAIDGDGNVYVVDWDTERIQVFDFQGRFLHKWRTDWGIEWGTDEEDDQFEPPPDGLAIDGDGNVYAWAEEASHLLMQDVKLAIGGDGNVYVADSDNHQIQVFDPQGRFLRKWGTEGEEDGQFRWAQGLAIDGDGNVYVADTFNHRIQVFKRVLVDG